MGEIPPARIAATTNELPRCRAHKVVHLTILVFFDFVEDFFRSINAVLVFYDGHAGTETVKIQLS